MTSAANRIAITAIVAPRLDSADGAGVETGSSVGVGVEAEYISARGVNVENVAVGVAGVAGGVAFTITTSFCPIYTSVVDKLFRR
jgi:hypothetical protein